jgi:hypothetical protein
VKLLLRGVRAVDNTRCVEERGTVGEVEGMPEPVTKVMEESARAAAMEILSKLINVVTDGEFTVDAVLAELLRLHPPETFYSLAIGCIGNVRVPRARRLAVPRPPI